jgi:S1-C subfamily serine protease
VSNTSQFVRFIADSPIGSTARIEVLREGDRTSVRVAIEKQEQRPRRGAR